MKKMMTVGCVFALAFTAGAATLKKGDTVAFLGDSITQHGWNKPSGYVRLCEAVFNAGDMGVAIVPAGVSGHKSDQMLKRLEKDVISKKPTFMTLSCGVNDVWHQDRNRGIKLPEYKANITKIIGRAQAAGIQVIVLTATMIKEDAQSHQNKKLVPYNEFLREIAKEKGCALVDLNAEMQKRVGDFRKKTGSEKNCLTTDGVHMDLLGNRMMALAILKDGFKFTDAELAAAQKTIDGLSFEFAAPAKMSVAEYLKLAEKAAAAKEPPADYLKTVSSRAVRAELAR